MSINQIVTIISGEDGSKDVYVKSRDSYKVRLREVIKEYEQLNMDEKVEK